MPDTLHHSEHKFTSSWRWPPKFEQWIKNQTNGYTANICGGLSTIGDLRIDIKNPTEIINDLQQDPNTSKSEFISIFSDLLVDSFTGRDMQHDLDQLYESDNPASHPIIGKIQLPQTVNADLLDTLPFESDTFETIIADPPWKELPDKKSLFDELTRITKPGGKIIFNAWFIPSNEKTTIETVRIRQDTNRHPTGTPNISYVSIFQVYESEYIAKYQHRTLRDHEHEPTPSSIEECYKTEIAADLKQDGISPTQYDMKAISPVDGYTCPKCDSHSLMIGNKAGGYDIQSEQIYECQNCRYPALESELKNNTETEKQILK